MVSGIVRVLSQRTAPEVFPRITCQMKEGLTTRNVRRGSHRRRSERRCARAYIPTAALASTVGRARLKTIGDGTPETIPSVPNIQ